VQGIARVKKDGAKISGDNFSFLEMERGELLLGLSDGMGSGSKACKESEMVLDLVERFLEAGFSAETAIRMMNSAMVLKGENDLYSTVDLCKVNLYTGRLYSYKIGAAATFIRHDGEVRILSSSNLPVGAEAAVEIQQQEEQLENGDFIVMVTDGVLEYLHVQRPEETMREMIESIETNNPGILSKRIMERVMLFTGGKAKDDMTVLAACIWEKN
jgi:stage II sporulation protein E